MNKTLVSFDGKVTTFFWDARGIIREEYNQQEGTINQLFAEFERMYYQDQCSICTSARLWYVSLFLCFIVWLEFAECEEIWFQVDNLFQCFIDEYTYFVRVFGTFFIIPYKNFQEKTGKCGISRGVTGWNYSHEFSSNCAS